MAKRPKTLLVEFAMQERQRACAVCKLPSDVKQQIGQRSRKIVRAQTVVAWLNAIGYPITLKQFIHHGCAGHANERIRGR